jgi:hypothetical protein
MGVQECTVWRWGKVCLSRISVASPRLSPITNQARCTSRSSRVRVGQRDRLDVLTVAGTCGGRAKTLPVSDSRFQKTLAFYRLTPEETAISSRDNIALTLASTPPYRAIPVTSWNPYTTADTGKTSHFQPAHLNQR